MRATTAVARTGTDDRAARERGNLSLGGRGLLDDRHPADGSSASAGRALSAGGLGVSGALALTALTAACWHRIALAGDSGALAGTLDVALGLELLCVAAAGLVAAWLAVLLLAGAVVTLPGRAAARARRAAVRLAPNLTPRIASALVAATMCLVPVGAAQAATSPTSLGAVTHGFQGSDPAAQPRANAPESGAGADELGTDAPEPSTGTPEPGWLPTSPSPAPDQRSIGLVSRGSAQPDVVVVRVGDTLWDITARHLGPDADAAEIARAWPQWHAANREVIGADPDLILPGTQLVPPTGDAELQEVGS